MTTIDLHEPEPQAEEHPADALALNETEYVGTRLDMLTFSDVARVACLGYLPRLLCVELRVDCGSHAAARLTDACTRILAAAERERVAIVRGGPHPRSAKGGAS